MTIIGFLKEILRGKDLYRILMNAECSDNELRGLVLDVGSGEGTSYHRFFKKSVDAKVAPLDLRTGIDFEKDPLPYAEGSVDFVLAFNVLEHIYHYQHLISDMHRVLRSGARLLGAVPFLLNYHPDPRDFWRFTQESLERILQTSGFANIEIIILGRGPCSAAFSQIEFLIPRMFKLVFIPMVLGTDRLLRVFKPHLPERFPLGYFFKATS